MDVVKDGKTISKEDVPLRNAMNEVLRDAYVEDCQRGVDKWNRFIAAHGIPFELKLPSRRFHRHIGIYADVCADPNGNLITKEEFAKKRDEWLPSDADKTFVKSLMTKPIFDPKQMASWISAPKQGIKGRAVDFEYVRHEA
jgi:benzoyl-CoA 2,3-dioxygenase component B